MSTESAILPPPAIEAEVLVYLGETLAEKYSINHGEFLIGRDKSCQMSIDADGVSRHHARLTFRGYELVIEDLGSSNGVFIEGIQVQLPSRVRPDQQVEVGSARLFIRLKAQASEMLAAALWDPDLGLAPVRALLQSKRYKVMGSIGRGGMGVVHQARDLRIHRQVAMKVIKTASQFSRENVLRFVDEAQLTGQLQHPNIVPVYELGLDDHDEVFYSMKYVHGITLDDVLKGLRAGDPAMVKEYSLAELLTIFQKVCDGVAFAHSKGVVHRDLKPDNIMIGQFGEVLVMDWGLAKRMSSGPHDERLHDPAPRGGDAPPEPELEMPPPDLRGFQTLNGLIVGTPPYIAPEAARGDLDQIDPRSDIYVLGAILYAMLTLRPPFPGKEFGELIEQIVEGRFHNPSTFSQTPKDPATPVEGPDGLAFALQHLPGRKIPEGLAAIILKAMSYPAEDRYQNVEALQDDITAWQNGFAPKAERAGLKKQILLWATRHKDKVAMLTAFAVIFHVAVIWFFLSLRAENKRARDNEQAAIEKQFQLDAALKDLQGAAPLFIVQAQQLIKQKDFDTALDRIEAAIRQVPNNADYHYLHGCVLQTHLRLDDAAEAFERTLDIAPNNAAAKENLLLTQKILAASGEDHEPGTAELTELQKAILKQGRLAEASAVAEKAGVDRPVFAKALREAIETNPELRPLRDLLDRREMRGRFTRQADGTYSANLRGLPAQNAVIFLRAQLIPVTSLYLDDVAITDLNVLGTLKLRILSLANCKNISDLTPLAGMPLQRLNISRTAVADLTPLAGMPLVELNLDGCKNVTDITPLRDNKQLETLLIPRTARDIEFLRTLPKLRFLSYKTLTQPASDFWKEFKK